MAAQNKKLDFSLNCERCRVKSDYQSNAWQISSTKYSYRVFYLLPKSSKNQSRFRISYRIAKKLYFCTPTNFFFVFLKRSFESRKWNWLLLYPPLFCKVKKKNFNAGLFVSVTIRLNDPGLR